MLPSYAIAAIEFCHQKQRVGCDACEVLSGGRCKRFATMQRYEAEAGIKPTRACRDFKAYEVEKGYCASCSVFYCAHWTCPFHE